MFAALSIMLVAQLIFILLESARNIEFYKVLKMNTDSVTESMFAEYVSPLWENYHILGVTAADGSGQFSLTNREAMFRKRSKVNMGGSENHLIPDGVSLLTADIVDVEFSEYLLMTDQEGKVFQAAVTAYMKHNLTYEMAQTVYNNYESVKDSKDEYGDGEASINGALDALESLDESDENTESRYTLKKAGAGASLKETEQGNTQDSDQQNVLTTVVETQKTGILSLVLPETARVSGSQMNLERVVSHRKLEQGTGSLRQDDSWYDQVLFHQYLVHYLSSYTDGETDRGLNYELEYLIGGKSKDDENLKIAVHEILAMREALNFASLMASGEKQAEALALATLLAGATVNPAIIEAVKYGILAAWAYAESILDMRTLLQGGKIPMVKSDVEWTSDLDAIPTLLSGWCTAKSTKTGSSYEDYLGMLLFFHRAETLSKRAMDVQEATIRRVEGYEGFRMDCLICETKVNVTYEYVPVFWGYVTLVEAKPERIGIQRTSQYSYLSQWSEDT